MIDFSYEDFEATRKSIVQMIAESLNDKDKAFLLSFNRLEPDWSDYDFQDFPSVKWKLINLGKLKIKNLDKYELQLTTLRKELKF